MPNRPPREVSGECGNVLHPFSKRWNADHGSPEPERQIRSESAVRHCSFQVGVRRHYEAKVTHLIVIRPHFSEHSRFESAQEFWLELWRQFPNFVEKKCAPMCLRQVAYMVGNRSRKGTPHVSEQKGFEDRVRDRAHIHGDELPASAACVVQSLCDELLSDAGWTLDEDGQPTRAESRNESPYLSNRGRVSNEVACRCVSSQHGRIVCH